MEKFKRGVNGREGMRRERELASECRASVAPVHTPFQPQHPVTSLKGGVPFGFVPRGLDGQTARHSTAGVLLVR